MPLFVSFLAKDNFNSTQHACLILIRWKPLKYVVHVFLYLFNRDKMRFIDHTGLSLGGKSSDGIFKFLRSPGIDFKESIPPAYSILYVAWKGRYDNPIPTRVQHSQEIKTEKGKEWLTAKYKRMSEILMQDSFLLENRQTR
jgi:hypothetical protein